MWKIPSDATRGDKPALRLVVCHDAVERAKSLSCGSCVPEAGARHPHEAAGAQAPRSFELLRQLLDTETIDLGNGVEQRKAIRRAARLALDYAACWQGITRIEGRPASLMSLEEFRETWPDAASPGFCASAAAAA